MWRPLLESKNLCLSTFLICREENMCKYCQPLLVCTYREVKSDDRLGGREAGRYCAKKLWFLKLKTS